MPDIAKTESPTKIRRRKPDSAVCEVCGRPESYYRECSATHWCCTWRGEYGQCRIPADFATGPVCAWHYDCKRFNYHGQDFPEFERWLDDRTKAYPYDTWHHCVTQNLWDAAQGISDPVMRDEFIPQKEQNTMLPRHENIRRLRELIDSLSEDKRMEDAPF